ncbi:MAG: tail fiber domain-containing protein, partial [Candidatus Aenigmatarchaeota archaeon]
LTVAGSIESIPSNGRPIISSNYSRASDLLTGTQPDNDVTLMGVSDGNTMNIGRYDKSGGSFHGIKSTDSYHGSVGIYWTPNDSLATGIRWDGGNGELYFKVYEEVAFQYDNHEFSVFNTTQNRVFNLDVHNEGYINLPGNFGIGTSDPNKKLTVVGDGNFTGNVYAENFSSQSPLRLQTNGETRLVINDTVDEINLYGNALKNVNWTNSDIGSGSDLNADKLDGEDASAFMDSGTDNWVNEGGDTMTGNLNMSGNNITNAGSVYGTGFYYTSDIRLKKDVKTLVNVLKRVEKLNGVRFDWKETNETEIGLIAQNVEEVYPELVSTNSDGMKTIQYGNLVGVLVEAIKEQNIKLKKQDRKIGETESRIQKIEKILCKENSSLDICDEN